MGPGIELRMSDLAASTFLPTATSWRPFLFPMIFFLFLYSFQIIISTPWIHNYLRHFQRQMRSRVGFLARCGGLSLLSLPQAKWEDGWGSLCYIPGPHLQAGSLMLYACSQSPCHLLQLSPKIPEIRDFNLEIMCKLSQVRAKMDHN